MFVQGAVEQGPLVVKRAAPALCCCMTQPEGVAQHPAGTSHIRRNNKEKSVFATPITPIDGAGRKISRTVTVIDAGNLY